MSTFVFVRFTEDRGVQGEGSCTLLVTGEGAKSPEAFIDWYLAGVEVRILEWFEVPEKWENLVAGDGNMNAALEALVGLDGLSDTPVVSDLLATIFEVAYRLGAQSKEQAT